MLFSFKIYWKINYKVEKKTHTYTIHTHRQKNHTLNDKKITNIGTHNNGCNSDYKMLHEKEK